MADRIKKTLIYPTSILLMILLIPLVKNDYILAIIYFLFILAVITTKKERMDIPFAVLGGGGMLFGEYVFLTTGVESFHRTSLFGVMPIWLPFMWSFIFIGIKRVFHIWYSN